ncbi:MAG TPA: polysaccharide biosynthesis protein, partial [Chryseosolibacter sp.]
MFQYSVIKWVYNLKILPRWVIIIIDLLFISLSTILGYLLRFNFDRDDILRNNFGTGVLISLACGFIAVLVTGSHKGIVRYTGLQDGVRIFFMVVLSSLFVGLFDVVYSEGFGDRNLIPFSVVLITFLASFLFL